ncbi:unnamed protein product [Cylicocyclus nassatus]|uniref:MULE transposase domain-containing protein n=1 Tax=Cylicocyclus nassatus TaxID=53992 RepID=A0AA36M674_CYLNA|nr:unnamed protein product [Cylicocyclus nassatus]
MILLFGFVERDLHDEMVAHHYKSGPVSSRDAIKRALKSHENPLEDASMTRIPEHLRVLPNGPPFVHNLDPTLHIYYSSATIQKAALNGLHTIVADGVHSFQPRQLRKTGQLYTAHGVCSNGVEVPLLYAVSARKTEEIYEAIFGHLRAELEASVMPPALRIVLDYERSAILAAGRVFPQARVQGCAFHLAQVWNRRRDKVGMTPFLEGPQKSVEVADWWDTIKGLVFLPRRLHREVRALDAPPVPVQHPAFTPCRLFLSYLRENWYEGMFSDMWDKYGLEELRTTNLAEAYHSQLNTLFDADHPQLGKLIEVLRDLNSEAFAALTALEQNPTHAKYLRRRDRERRERIATEMRR